MYRFLSIMVVITTLCIMIGCSSSAVSVGKNPKAIASAVPENEVLVLSLPGDLPDWINEPSKLEDKKNKYFVGLSKKFAMEQDARNDAVKNGREQIADYLGVDVKRLIREVTAFIGTTSDIIDLGIVADSASQLASEASVLGTTGQKFYTEKWKRTTGDLVEFYWKAYVLVPFPKNARYDLALAALKDQRSKEKDEQRIQNIDQAINRMEELKKQGWFEK